MKEVKPSKKPLLFYYGIVLLCVVLFNAFIAPMLMDDPVKEVDYGTFMRMVDNKEVDKVQVNTNEITFMDKEGKVYYTSAMEDPDLTQRLYESGAAFDRVIEKTMSPLVSYLITGVLPIILFVALGQYLYKRLMSQAGGKDSLMFGGMGKSNAKIYIQSTEGIHFDDVAGEDEAKESLAEIVDYLHNPTKYSEVGASMPKGLTAATGMDALTHAVEAYLCWTNNTAESIRLAEEAVNAIFKYLERAYNNGSDMEAREEMLKASFKAGFAFTRAGVGNVHAIAHTMGGIYGTPHGLANAVILPIVLEDYGEVVYKKLAHLAEISGVARTGSDEEKAKAFIAEIYAMNKRMGIPEGLHVEEKDIPQMVEWALAEANPTYPVPVLYDEARCAAVIRRINERA